MASEPIWVAVASHRSQSPLGAAGNHRFQWPLAAVANPRWRTPAAAPSWLVRPVPPAATSQRSSSSLSSNSCSNRMRTILFGESVKNHLPKVNINLATFRPFHSARQKTKVKPKSLVRKYVDTLTDCGVLRDESAPRNGIQAPGPFSWAEGGRSGFCPRWLSHLGGLGSKGGTVSFARVDLAGP